MMHVLSKREGSRVDGKQFDGRTLAWMAFRDQVSRAAPSYRVLAHHDSNTCTASLLETADDRWLVVLNLHPIDIERLEQYPDRAEAVEAYTSAIAATV